MGEMETLYQADVSASRCWSFECKICFSKENLQKRDLLICMIEMDIPFMKIQNGNRGVFWLQENTVTDCVEDFKSVTDCIVQTDIQIKRELEQQNCSYSESTGIRSKQKVAIQHCVG